MASATMNKLWPSCSPPLGRRRPSLCCTEETNCQSGTACRIRRSLSVRSGLLDATLSRGSLRSPIGEWWGCREGRRQTVHATVTSPSICLTPKIRNANSQSWGSFHVTHVFYTAFQAAPGSAAELRLQYGSKSRDVGELGHRHKSRRVTPDQIDWLTAYQRGKEWDWVELRPQTLCCFSPGSPMSILPAIAVYAAISRELGLPLRFPGKPGAYDTLYQVTEFDAFCECSIVGCDGSAMRK